ncbi:sulfurtransferase complex subunit TusC [Vibrionales bacterium C3R12]|nr:sulfurtransferase complex subunit TusC [Vibrionales bacterium C3R12]
MKSIAFVFKSSPHTTSKGREGLDALLAASAYSENIHVFFIAEGVAQLILNQQPEVILGRDYINAFKLMELYEIENIYACQESYEHMGLLKTATILEPEWLSKSEITAKLQRCNKILTF